MEKITSAERKREKETHETGRLAGRRGPAKTPYVLYIVPHLDTTLRAHDHLVRVGLEVLEGLELALVHDAA